MITRATLLSIAALFFATSSQAQSQNNQNEPDKGKLRRPGFIELRTDPPQANPPQANRDKPGDSKKPIIVYLPSTKTQARMPSAMMGGDYPLPSGYRKSVKVKNSERTIPRPSGKSNYQRPKQQTLRKPSFGRFPTNYRK